MVGPKVTPTCENMSRVIVKNLPLKTTEKALSELFSQCGEVTDSRLIRTRAGASRRFGFVGLASEAAAQRAVETFDRSFVGATRISVELAKPYGDESLERPWSKYSQGSSAFSRRGKERKERETGKAGNSSEVKVKKAKKPAALAEVEDDEEFQEFLSVHTHKSQVQTWADEGGRTSKSKKTSREKKERNELTEEERERKLKHESFAGSAGESSGKEDIDEEAGEVASHHDDGFAASSAISGETDMDYLRSKVVSELTADDEDADMSSEDGTEGEGSEGTSESESEEETPSNQGLNEFSSTLFTLRMRGLPFSSKEKDVETFFHPLALADVRFTVDQDGRPSGRAYVDFNSEEELAEALKRNGDCIGKRYIELFRDEGPRSGQHEAKSEPKREFGTGRGAAKNDEEEEETIADSGRLFLRNLSFTVSEDDLTEVFERYGPLTEVTVPLDKTTNRPTGLGFVTFMLPEHAVKAYEAMDGQVFQGRLLHILPARPRQGRHTQEGDDPSAGGTFKKKKEKEQKSRAGSSYNWNTLLLGANSVAEAMARRYSTTKSSILDPESDRSAAVRVALGETQLISETREFLEAEGVHLDVFEKKNRKRSSTVIIVKNLPHGTRRSELEELFSSHGSLHKVVLPPAGISALVEFLEPSQAKEAFRRLAYTKFKHIPLYLEWAPIGAIRPKKKMTKKEKEVDREVMDEDEKDVGEKREENEAAEVGEGCTLFVKNLNFSSDEESLRGIFSRIGGLAKVEIARKRNTKDPSHPLSMGFGFVEFSSHDGALEALKSLQHVELDGHKLELKLSHRAKSTGAEDRARKLAKKSEQKSAKIMVRNIPFEANQREVRELFQTFGQLKTVRLPKKMAAMGRHRGFGFVEFMTKEDARRAFESLCHSTHLYGRRLVLEWAEGEENVEEIRKRTADHFHGFQRAGGVSSKRRKAEFLLYGNGVDKDID